MNHDVLSFREKRLELLDGSFCSANRVLCGFYFGIALSAMQLRALALFLERSCLRFSFPLRLGKFRYRCAFFVEPQILSQRRFSGLFLKQLRDLPRVVKKLFKPLAMVFGAWRGQRGRFDRFGRNGFRDSWPVERVAVLVFLFADLQIPQHLVELLRRIVA